MTSVSPWSTDPIHAFHAKQLSNMQRRINEQGTLTERKKNKMGRGLQSSTFQLNLSRV